MDNASMADLKATAMAHQVQIDAACAVFGDDVVSVSVGYSGRELVIGITRHPTRAEQAAAQAAAKPLRVRITRDRATPLG